MAISSPTGGPALRNAVAPALRPPPASTAERVAALEADLAHYHAVLMDALRTVQAVHASDEWRFGNRWLRRCRRILPPGTRRQAFVDMLARTALHFGRALARGIESWRSDAADRAYAAWRARYEPSPAELAAQRQTPFPDGPRFSLVVPVPADATRWLPALVRSVRGQTYAGWELLLACAGEPVQLDRAIAAGRAGDGSIRVVRAPAGACRADRINAALATATGDFVAVLDAADVLAPFALFALARAAAERPEADVLYADEDRLCGRRRHDPWFRPDWSPDTLRGHNYLGRFVPVRRTLLAHVGGLRPGADGSDDYDLVLRATEQARAVVHVPQVLYHRRAHAAGPPPPAPPWVLAEHLRRQGETGTVGAGPMPGVYAVRYALPSRPLVSIVIANRDQPAMLRRCMASVRTSTYPRYEVVVVENQSRLAETFACYDELVRAGAARVLTWPRPFNYAAVNNFGAAQARGEVLLFLNNDTEVINPDWLERLLEHALRPAVGAVGAMLYYPDGTVQHAGVTVGIGDGAGHCLRGTPRGQPGYGNRLACAQDLSAVTGACLMTRREIFAAVGGFDERFAMLFNDIDLCLKIRQRGYRVVWTPAAELYHHESVSQGRTRDAERQVLDRFEAGWFARKWRPLLAGGDPYYSPNLTRTSEDCSPRP